MDATVAEDLRDHVCLYGFDEETDVEEKLQFFPHGHIEAKSKKVQQIHAKMGISLSAALSLCEVTPAEWGLMQVFFRTNQ